MTASFKDLVDVFQNTSVEKSSSIEEAFGSRELPKQDVGLERVVCRVFGQTGKPALVDLDSRSVYPVKE